MMVEAVVLAGALNDGRLGEVSAVEHEALIPIHGRPMIQYVLEALRATRTVSRIVVVGPASVLISSGAVDGVDVVDGRGTMVQNLRIGVDRLQPTGPVLVVTSDIPLIHPEAIDDFVERCRTTKADIYYPIVRKETNERAFPGVKRTYVHLKDGVFTGGNLALLDPKVIPACEGVIAQAVAMRKKPWQLSRMLGFIFIVKLLARRLALNEIEDRVKSILGFYGVGVESPYPEVGIDVDKPEDLALVEQAFGGRQ